MSGKLVLTVNPYNDSRAPRRQGAFIVGEWNDALERELRDAGVKALYLNSARGWRSEDFGFLGKLEFIEQLHIVCSEAEKLEALEMMRGLVDLSITAFTRSRVDFTKIRSLRSCELNWWPAGKSILECCWLQHLRLDGAKTVSWDQLEAFRELEELTLTYSNVVDVGFIRSLKALHKLEFSSCRKITSFDPLLDRPSLQWLRIDHFKDIGDIEFVRNLTELEVLILSDTGKIASLAPVQKLRKLQALSFSGSTVIVNGNLGCLEELPKLAMLMFAPRRHYTHRLIKPWNWNNRKNPDVLLGKK